MLALSSKAGSSSFSVKLLLEDIQWCRGGRGGSLEHTGKDQPPSLLILQTLAVPTHPPPSYSSAHPSWILSLPPMASIIIYLITILRSLSQTPNPLLNSEQLRISTCTLHGALTQSMRTPAFIVSLFPHTFTLSHRYRKYHLMMPPTIHQITELPHTKHMQSPTTPPILHL